MPVKCLRVHVAVPDRGQRLHTEEETIEKPAGAGSSGHAVRVDAIKNCKEKIQPDVDGRDEQSEFRPGQAEQPAIHIAQLSFVGVDFDELDRAGADRNSSVSQLAKSIVHRWIIIPMWPFKKLQLPGPEAFPS